MRSVRSILVLAILAGCSASDLSIAENDTDTILDSADPTDSDDAPDLPDATWAALSGTIVLSSGDADIASSALSWVFYDGDRTEICRYTAPLATLTPAAPPDPEVIAWWSTSTDDTDDDGSCDLRRPQALELGLGTLDPALAPAMSDAELDDAAPYGLYARVGWKGLDADTPLWVFGVAGTDGAFDGTDPAATEGPLPDGIYSLQPLHLFAVP